MNENMTQPVTRGELHEALGIWGGALRAELATRADLNELRVDLRAEMKQMAEALRAEMKQMAEALMAQMKHLITGAFENQRSEFGVMVDKIYAVKVDVNEVDAKYSDLPPRVEALERKAAGRTKRR